MNDNTVGGVTGTGSPTPGDWYGVIMSGSGSVDATYPRVDWARLPMWADTTGSVVFDHDTFANDANGVGVIAPEPVLTDNMATNLGSQPSVGSNSYSPAYAVWSSTLNLDNITGNNAAGGDPVFFVAGTAVDSTMNPNQIPFAVGGGPGGLGYSPFGHNSIEYTLDVPAGVTLTVAAGTVIKAFDGQFCTDIPDIACSMSVEGTLTVAGTSGSPVVFTSMNDNTVGGVTGTGSPTPGDWYGVIMSGSGSVDATYARVDWARLPMWADTTGSVVFDHDTFANDANGVGVIAPEPVLTDNMATNLGSQPSVGSNSYSPAYAVWSSTLNLDNITGNNAAGGDPVFFVAGTAVDSTMNPNQIPFAVGGGPGGLGYSPFGHNSIEYTLDVPAGVTLTVAAGTVIKAFDGQFCTDIPDIACSMSVEGTLTVAGTSGSPVVFTSMNDNTVGGVTGTGSPTPGDWGGVVIGEANAGDNVINAVIKYASTAIAVNQLDALEVDSTEFAYDSAAFTVSSTPVVSELLGQLDCAPPYTSFVLGINDWFGTTGIPGADVDLGSIVDLVIPEGLKTVWDDMTPLMPSVEGTFSDNTIPWTFYSCSEAFEIPIPVTPILVGLAPTAAVSPAAIRRAGACRLVGFVAHAGAGSQLMSGSRVRESLARLMGDGDQAQLRAW